jgi:uncharacterized membrane protein HdeD (DUF308 family)
MLDRSSVVSWGDEDMNECDGFPTLPDSEGNRRWLLVLGLGLILLGVVGLGSVVAMQLLAVLVLGPLLITSGILQVLLAFFSGKRLDTPLHLTAAALDFVVGFLVLTHPHKTIDDLVLVLAALLMAGGISRVLGSLFLRFRSWGWILAAGLVAVVLGGVVWKEGHFRGLTLVLACVAIDFIAHGVSWVMLSHRVRFVPSTTPDAQPSREEVDHEERSSPHLVAHGTSSRDSEGKE